MKNNNTNTEHGNQLSYWTNLLLLLVLVVVILIYGRPFLMPAAIGGILALLFVPLSRKLESKGVKGFLAGIICILIFLIGVAVIIGLLSWQISDLAKDAGALQERIVTLVQQVQTWVSDKFDVPVEEQNKLLKTRGESFAQTATQAAYTVLNSILSSSATFFMIIIYAALFLIFRHHIKAFILKLVKEEDRPKTDKILKDVSTVAQSYLSGTLIMLSTLAIMYGIGFSIIGIKNALFFALLCAVLEIVPYVGNLTGTVLTIAMAFIQGGGVLLAVGVLVVYNVVQVVQTYLLQPFVVGAEVNVHPMFTIIILFIGNMLWGIPGMIVALPLLGMAKIICDRVEPLKPLGFLIGEENKKEKHVSIMQKIKNLLPKSVKRKVALAK